MAHISVASMRGCGLQPGWVCVDRRTALGNPFKQGTREQNIDRYRRWLWTHIKRGHGPAFRMFERLVAQARERDPRGGCFGPGEVPVFMGMTTRVTREVVAFVLARSPFSWG